MQLSPSWKKTTYISCIISSILGFSPFSYANSPLFFAEISPPKDFESLNQPQKTAIDVYFGDRYITTQMATYTSGWITLSNPKAILEGIGNIVAPKVVLNSLTNALSTNSASVCYQKNEENCGKISPRISGVIFNESKFRVDVFINPTYLKLTPATATLFLPASSAKKSFIQQINGNISGTRSAENSSNDYTFLGTSIFAVKENHLHIDYDYSKANNLSLDHAILGHEYKGELWQTGLLTSSGFGMAFTNDHPMWGVRVASSLNTRLDRGLSEGTPLQIFMPVRGRVDIIRNGRLIYTTFKEAGNHLINTSSFPSGSYDITVRIIDNNGQIVNEQSRIFDRDLDLPKMGAPSYFIEAGKVVYQQSQSVIPGITQNYLARAGMNYRLADAWAVTGTIAGTQGKSFGEVSVFTIGKYYKVSPGVMLANDKSHGVKINSQFNWSVFVATVNYSRLWNTHNADVMNTVTTINGISTLTTDVDTFSLLQNSFEQVDVSLSAPLMDGRAGYHSYYRRQHSLETTSIQAIEYSQSLYQDPIYTVTSHVSYSQSKGDKIFQLSFEVGWNTSEHTYQSATALGIWQKQSGSDGESAASKDYNLRYQLGWNSADTLNQDINARLVAQNSKDQTYVQGTTTVGSSYGAISGTLTQAHTHGKGNSTGYAAGFSASLFSDGKNTSLGGNKLRESGVMVDIKGVPKSETFNVLVNGQRVGVASGSAVTLVPLAPFATYEVKLVPNRVGFFNFNENTRPVTLYPGNIVGLDYQIQSSQLIFGRLLNKEGKPVKHAEIIDIANLHDRTDKYGLFQLNVPFGKKSLTFKEGEHQCTVTIPNKQKLQTVIRAGNIICANL